jgi:hypothetical protein
MLFRQTCHNVLKLKKKKGIHHTGALFYARFLSRGKQWKSFRQTAHFHAQKQCATQNKSLSLSKFFISGGV